MIEQGSILAGNTENRTMKKAKEGYCFSQTVTALSQEFWLKSSLVTVVSNPFFPYWESQGFHWF